MGQQDEQEEIGTAVTISGPERDVQRIVDTMRDAGVPIINDPPELKAHPAPEAPEHIRVCAVMIDCRNWPEGSD